MAQPATGKMGASSFSPVKGGVLRSVMSLLLQILALFAVAYLLMLFGHGIAVMVAGEMEWEHGKRWRGWRARSIGLLMILAVPLTAGFVMLLAAFLDGWGLQDATNSGLILSAGIAWLIVRQARISMTTPCPQCGKPLRSEKASQCFECGADWPRDGHLA